MNSEVLNSTWMKKNGNLKMQVKRLDGQLTNSTLHLPYLLQAVEIVFNSRYDDL
ncbi:conserved hypothetical protein [Trichinella spiralis]|uniref:hypothetical protein n=1 Tax=Trichinella spiralis TaxID=6334 RepID=UPI0001EFBF1E|nr:conserved hypothetical protein [Trichinella spiralis]